MKKNKLFWIFNRGSCVLNFAAHLYFYPSLPDIVPTPLGSQRAGQRLGAEIHGLILAALAVCDVDFV